ncbi:MAG TPA: SHOCT domain-containing protein [Candidatus Angelobacter sp.]|nr:SHOCT domain-containing protein [Candidatus Angelobacter sp.]
MRRLHLLLIVWCVLLLAPGLFEAAGHSTLNGTLAAIWVVGYLVQFGVFMWIMNLVAEQKVLWWFIASMLPWVIDWSVPSSSWLLLPWAAVAIAAATWIGRVTQRATSLQEHGVRATGTVLEVFKPWMNVVVNNVYIRRRVRLRIQREDGTPAYEGILKGLFMLGEIPSVGDRLHLRVDPANPQHFDYDQASTSAAAATAPHSSAEPFHSRQGDHSEQRDHRQGDYSVEGDHSGQEDHSGQGDLVAKLARLADLRDRGALTDAEFAAAKKKLLR